MHETGAVRFHLDCIHSGLVRLNCVGFMQCRYQLRVSSDLENLENMEMMQGEKVRENSEIFLGKQEKSGNFVV